MITDTSFSWRKDEGIEDIDTGNNTLAQDQGDYNIIRPVAILKLVGDTSPDDEKEISNDPYDGYWTKIPLQ